MKTITIRDDVYNMLLAIKGEKSFSEIIKELIKRDVKKRGEAILKICNLFGEPEKILVEAVEKGVKVEDTLRYFLSDRTKGKQ